MKVKVIVKPTTRKTINSPMMWDGSVEKQKKKKKSDKKNEKKGQKRKADASLSPREDRPYVPPQIKSKEHIEEIQKKVPLPPPIMVDEVDNVEDFRLKTLKDISKNCYRMRILNNRKIKINVSSTEDYRTITSTLTDKKIHWFSFENKDERPYRVMVKKLHHSSSPDHIKEDLKEQGFKILDAVNKIGWHSKQKLDMFEISFEKSEDIEKINNIKVILNQIVEVEALRKNKILVQCKKCQSFGHSHNYCGKEPRCVKCVGKHLTSECSKVREDPAKCVLCGDAHPANYRGCTVAKELQKIKNKSTINNKVVAGTSYAQAAAKNQKVAKEQPKPANTVAQTLEIILSKLNSFDERLKKLENSSRGAIPKTNK